MKQPSKATIWSIIPSICLAFDKYFNYYRKTKCSSTDMITNVYRKPYLTNRCFSHDLLLFFAQSVFFYRISYILYFISSLLLKREKLVRNNIYTPVELALGKIKSKWFAIMLYLSMYMCAHKFNRFKFYSRYIIDIQHCVVCMVRILIPATLSFGRIRHYTK